MALYSLVTTAYCVFLAMFLRDLVCIVMLIVSNDSNLQTTFDNYIIILLNIRITAYFCTLWMLLWNITVLICLVCLIISREFQECTRDLESILDEDGPFPCKLFYEKVERFRQLTLIVNKVEEIFSVFLGIILASTLSLICGTTYYVVERESFETWDSVLVFSVIFFAVLLSSLATLNHRVRKRKNDVMNTVQMLSRDVVTL